MNFEYQKVFPNRLSYWPGWAKQSFQYLVYFIISHPIRVHVFLHFIVLCRYCVFYKFDILGNVSVSKCTAAILIAG